MEHHNHEVIDKVVTFGVPNPQRLKLSQIITNKIKVVPLQYYSTTKKLQSHQEIDYEMWAYPDGIKIYNQHHQILNDRQPQFSFTQTSDIISDTRNNHRSFIESQATYQLYPPDYIYSFILTDYSLTRTYCTCLSWNEKIFIKNDLNNCQDTIPNTSNININTNQYNNYQDIQILQQYKKNSQTYSKAIPKCKLSSLINNPLILDPTVTLVYIPKSMIICSVELGCIQLQRKLLEHFYQSVVLPKRENKDNLLEMKVDLGLYKMFERLCIINGYPMAQKLFDSKTFGQKDRRQQLSQHHSNQTNILSIKKHKLQQFYLSTLFLLTKTPKKYPILSENGIPITSQITTKTAYNLPQYFDSYSENASLLPLSLDKIIVLWKCLLLEKQILIFASSQYQVIILCEFLLYLLRPIKWENIYIPFLPFHLSHHVDAIGGYIIGMSNIHMEYMMANFQLNTKVVVDMKNKTIVQEGGQSVIELPSIIQNYLEKNISSILHRYEQQLRTIQRNSGGGLSSFLSLTSLKGSPKNPLPTSLKTLYITCTLQLQRYFFNSIVYLFNNFIPFIQRRLQGVICFKTNEYLGLLEDDNHKKIMKQICKTMVFIRLCEYHLEESEKCAWIQRTIGQLFVYSHDILSQKYMVKFKNNQTLAIQDRILIWPLDQLLNPQNKYYQYHSYLWQKNLQQLLKLVKTADAYFSQQTKKYTYLYTHNPQQSNQHPLPLPSESQENSPIKKKQIKWKRYGQKDQQDLYQQAHKIIFDVKIQKYLVKYIKYLENCDPKRIHRVMNYYEGGNKRRNGGGGGGGWFSWFWEVINPPIMSRTKQEEEKKTRLKRKLTEVSGIFNLALNLHKLFHNDSEKQEKQEIRELHRSPNYEDKIMLKHNQSVIVDFCEYQPQKNRLSKACSDGVSEIKKRRKSQK